MTDEEQAQQLYLAARVAAMAEFDMLEPEFKAMQKRMFALRRLIVAVSDLTRTDIPDEKYDFVKPSADTYTGGHVSHRKKWGHAREKDRGKTNFPVANTGATAGE